ncbi:unnamed protein product [Mytilus coruscus]|nr:unnamed protein product [Mytilus coruscus]
MIETDTGNFVVSGMIENVLVDKEGGVYNDGYMIPHNSSAKSVKSRTSRDVTIYTSRRYFRSIGSVSNDDTSANHDAGSNVNREVIDLNTDQSESRNDSDQDDVGMALG